jgi:aminocarboxymuconate-semialdehyde decarboxylase
MTTRREFLQITTGALTGIAFVGCELDVDLAKQVVKIQNEKLAEACAAERFVAFATVALQHPELAAEQLEEGMKKHGLRGAGIGGSVNGQEISDPKFNPFWAKAEQLGAVVFIHPQGDGAAAPLRDRLKGNGYLDNVIGNPLERVPGPGG